MDCQICGKSFRKMYSYNVHKKLHVFKCKQCTNEFFSKKKLEQHEMDHVKYKRICKICNVIILSEELYGDHRHIHIRKNFNLTSKYKCDNCERSFAYEKSFKNHLFKCENKSSELQCDLCSAKPFSSKSGLEQHVRKHTSEYTFICNVCKKGFLRKSEMLAHTQSHGVVLKDHPFRCGDCGATFSKQFNLERHAIRFHYIEESSIQEDYSLLIGLEIEILN